MNSRTRRIGVTRLRGLPAILVLVLLAILILAILALVFFVGLAVAVTGLIASAVAALFYAIHRRLPGRAPEATQVSQHHAVLQEPGQVRDIQVDQIIVDKRE